MDTSSAQGVVADLGATTGRKVGRTFDAIARWSVYLAILLIPLLYLPFTIEGLELSKQVALVVLTVVATLAWLGRMLVDRKLALRRSVMNLLVVIFVVIYALSAWVSKNHYLSFIGDFSQEKAGLVTVGCFALLFFVAINVLQGAKEVRKALCFMLSGGFLAIAHAYAQAFGLRIIPGAAARSGSFNLMGTATALGMYASVLLAILMGMFLMPMDGKLKQLRTVLMGLLSAGAFLFIASLSFWALWVSVIISSTLLVFFGMIKIEKVRRVTMLSVPMAAIVIAIVFSFIRFPISLGAPAEVMPSIKASWNIARASLAANPLLGSGPGTFLYAYAQFHSPDLNQTQFWNTHFDRSSSRLLTILATTGILGLVAFLVLMGYLAFRTVLRLWKGSSEWGLTLGIFSGWLALVVGKLFYSSNMTLEFAFWMLTAFLTVLEWDQWQEAKFERSPRAALGLSFFFIVTIIFGIAGLYLEGQRYVSEVAYASGLNRNLQKIDDVDASITDLTKATQLNPQNDLFLRTLSQSFTLRTNLELQKVGAKPTDDDTRRIAQFAANAINAGKQSTVVAPMNVQNWASLADLYLALVGATQGADTAAIDAYQHAIALEPNNPSYYTSLGRVYLTVGDTALAKVQQDKDDATKKTDQQTADDALSKAQDNFNKSLSLKPDYALAQYWLAISYQRMGKTAEAVKKLESALAIDPSDLGVGFQLGIMYFQNGQKDKAIAMLERVTQLSPQYSDAQWYLSAMYEDAGRIDDAIARVQIVLSYNKNNQTVQQRLTNLQDKKNGTPTAPAQPGLPAPPTAPSDTTVIPTTPPPAPVVPPKKKK